MSTDFRIVRVRLVSNGMVSMITPPGEGGYDWLITSSMTLTRTFIGSVSAA